MEDSKSKGEGLKEEAEERERMVSCILAWKVSLKLEYISLSLSGRRAVMVSAARPVTSPFGTI